MLPAERELAVKIGVGEEANGLGNSRAIRALSRALVAHSAVWRANVFIDRS